MSDGEADDDADEDGAGTSEKEVVVNFGFASPQEIDYHGMRALLATYHDGETFDVSGLVDTILQQVHADGGAWWPAWQRTVTSIGRMA